MGEPAHLLYLLGEVSEDSDGPIEWCRPVPDEPARELAAEIPELHLRTEPRTVRRSSISAPEDRQAQPQWKLVMESLHAWAVENAADPSGLGARVTYLAEGPRTETSAPDCDFAVPIS